MTRVCVRCGWFVFGRERCGRCAGPAIDYKAACRAIGVPGLTELLHVTPDMRVANFERYRTRSRRGERSALASRSLMVSE